MHCYYWSTALVTIWGEYTSMFCIRVVEYTGYLWAIRDTYTHRILYTLLYVIDTQDTGYWRNVYVLKCDCESWFQFVSVES